LGLQAADALPVGFKVLALAYITYDFNDTRWVMDGVLVQVIFQFADAGFGLFDFTVKRMYTAVLGM